MKILKPVEKDQIPERNVRDYEPIYQQALSLNGVAVPVEFDRKEEALNFRWLLGNKKGRGYQLGLRASLRGKTVYVYKP